MSTSPRCAARRLNRIQERLHLLELRTASSAALRHHRMWARAKNKTLPHGADIGWSVTATKDAAT
jgi:hypothetical protein